MEKSRILVTGGAGFIGHHFIEYLLNLANFMSKFNKFPLNYSF